MKERKKAGEGSRSESIKEEKEQEPTNRSAPGPVAPTVRA